MDVLNVYRLVDGNENLIAEIAADNAVLAKNIMKKNELSVSITTDYIPDIQEGDYIKLNDVIYKLNRDSEFRDKSSVNHVNTYLFEAPEYTLIDKILTHRVTGSTKVTLVARLRDWLDLLIWNVNKTNENPLGVDTGWSLGEIPDTGCLLLSFDGIDCRSLLSELASAYNYEFYVENKTINYVSRIERERNFTFTQGKGGGLYEIEQTNVDNGDVTTRIYPVGGTENITPGEGDEEGRLILPERYLENFKEVTRVVEKKVKFDDIYPSFTGIVNNPHGTNNREFTCPEIDFNINELAVGNNARVNFLTGDLMGKSFEFEWDNSTKKITLIYQEDELAPIDPSTNKRPTIPSSSKYLRGGEEFNFTGIKLGDSYKNNAISRLRDKATKWLEFYSQKRIKFNLDIDYRYMRGKGDLECGDLITVNIPERNISRLIRIISIEKNLKTGKLSCTVSNYLTEKWEDKIEGQISSIQSTINGGGLTEDITIIEKWDERPLNDRNVLSSLRSLKEIDDNALSKNHEDITEYLLKLLGGIISPFLESPDFVTGPMGAGFTIKQNADGQSYAEVDKLLVRMKAVFQTLEIMKTELAGASFMFNASGARATITKVEYIDRWDFFYSDGKAKYYSDGKRAYVQPGKYGAVYRCYFLTDDGEEAIENRFRVGNLVRSQTFNIKAGVHENVSNRYWWRRVENVGENWIDISATYCDADSDIPQIDDVIVQLGDDTDPDYQSAIVLSAYGDGAPYLTMYQGINSFSLSGKDVFTIGYDRVNRECYLKNYGRAYIGNREETNYLRLVSDGLEVRAKRFLFSNGEDIETRIEATEKNITLKLKDTGIDIESGQVTVTAERFLVQGEDGTPMAVFKVVDGKPLLKAENIDVDNLKVKYLDGAEGSLVKGSIGGFILANGRIGVEYDESDPGNGLSITNTLIKVGEREIYTLMGGNTCPAIIPTRANMRVYNHSGEGDYYDIERNVGIDIDMSDDEKGKKYGTAPIGINSNAACHAPAFIATRAAYLSISGDGYLMDLSRFNVFRLNNQAGMEVLMTLPDSDSIKEMFRFDTIPTNFALIVTLYLTGGEPITLNGAWKLIQGQAISLLVTETTRGRLGYYKLSWI